MCNVTKDQHFPRNPNYNDPGILGGTWTNTVTGEIWECVGHYNINALKIMDSRYIWCLKDDNSSGSGGGAKEPYIEETYDTDGYLISAVMHGYTKVPSYKFSDNGKLQTFFDYGTTIKSIEKLAFNGCTSLALTSLPNSVTNIERNAFDGCTSLALTSLPDGITSIGQGAFSGCTSLALTSLPSGLTEITNYAFVNCTSLVSMSIHSGINTIDPAAFGKCGGLTSVTFEGKPSGNMAKNIFQGCINLTEIKVPWAEGAVANAPWGATNATITYNYTGE